MATSTLSETDTGVYIDSTGDIVFVFTDEDGKNKSLILQEDDGKNFGRLAHLADGYDEWDYAPYTPVRLLLPNIKRPDTPAYSIEEIERYGEDDGAWIGDQSTLIIHSSDGNPPDRTLHIMFSYDTYNELEFVRYHFSTISSSVAKTEKFRPIMDDEQLHAVPVTPEEANMPDHTPDAFRDKLDDIQKQIDRMGDKISNALNVAHTAQMTADSIASHVSTLEEETKHTPKFHDMPDSEGFWRDSDGDIWVRDIVGNMRLIAKGHKDDDEEIYNQSIDFSSDFSLYQHGPYVKLDNPFIRGGDHAE